MLKLILLALPVLSFAATKVEPSQPHRAINPPPAPHSQSRYGDLPLAFEPNLGQTDPQVRFLTHSQGMTVFFTDTEAVMVLHKSASAGPGPRLLHQASPKVEQEVVRMKLAGAGIPGQTAGFDKLPGISNYFIGNDPAKWHSDIPNYARIRYQGVYPGVDLLAYGNERQLEYDLIVSPGADPSQIVLAWEGVDRMQLNAEGDLVLATRLGDVVQKRPRVYQEIGGRRVEIVAHYALLAGGRVQFALARYDRRLPLVIDPVTVVYGTYLGLSWQGSAIAVDSTGAAYVTGYTYDTNFPLRSAFQRTDNDGNCSGATTFVTKLAPAGNALTYSTYLGGSCEDDPHGIAVDANGSAYVVGTAGSLDFPLVLAYQSSCPNDIPGGQYGGVFVSKLSAAGNALSYSTYLCGGYSDHGMGIAVDSTGAAYITGDTSSDFWPLQGAYQPLLNGNTNAFVAKLSPTGTSLVYSTYLGGGNDYGTAIALDSTGAAYITGYTNSNQFPISSPTFEASNRAQSGYTGFVAKLSPTGNSLEYSTYLGGSGGDQPNGIAVDAGDAAFVTGIAYSTDFPLRNPYQSTNKNADAGTCFVTKFATAGNSLIYSTYLGGSPASGSSGDLCNAIAVDSAKEAYVTGQTYSPDFPLLSPVEASMPPNATYLAFVTKFSATGTLAYSTFLGGSDNTDAYAIAVDSAAAAYVTGNTASLDFPVPNGFQTFTSTSGGPFIAKLQTTGGATTVVTTSPAGLTFTVDGTAYTSTQNFTWTAGTNHTIGVSSPQTLPGVNGTRYLFANWSDSGLENHTITASSSGGTYTANFTAQYLLTVTESPAAGGSVTENPPSSDLYYNGGTSVQLTAAPNSGYTFTSWSGDLTGTTNPQSLTMNAPHNVTATFSGQASPVLSITKTHTGNFTQGQASAVYTVTVSNHAGAGATSGTVTVTEQVPAYLTLTGMSGSGWSCSGNTCTRSDALSGGASYPAITVTVSVAGNAPSSVTNQVSVSGSGFTTATASDVTTIVSSGGQTIVTTTPAGLTFTVDGMNYTTAQTFTWTVGTSHSIGVITPQVSGGTHYGFSSWSDGGQATHNITASSAGGTFTATFSMQYLLTTSVSPAGGGSIMAFPSSTDGYYTFGTSVQLTATPNAGYSFTGWSGDLSGTANPQSVTMNAAHSVTASFSGGSGGATTINTVPPGLAITVDSANYTAPHTFSWTAGSSHSIGVATTQGTGGTQYVFVSWSDGGQATHSITASSSGGAYTATFTTQYLLTLSVSGSGTVTASPTSSGGYYNAGTAVQLTASPNAPSAFTGWSGALSGSVNPQSITMNAAHSVTATFSSSSTAGLYFIPVTPCRVADTRQGSGKTGAFGAPNMAAGASRDFPIPQSACGIPASAQAYSLNVTAVPPGALIYLSIWPTGQPQPVVSTLNAFDGSIVANAALVLAGTNGSISIYVSNTTDVIIDINGYFAPPSSGGLAFYPVAPCRVVDTRGTAGPLGGPTMTTGSSRTFPVTQSACGVPATAQAYSLNMTVVPAGTLGWLTTWPTGQTQPLVSTLNSLLGKVLANAAIVPAGTGASINVYVSNTTDVIVDINGYFAPPGGAGGLAFYTATPCRLVDTRGNGLTGIWGTPMIAGGTYRDFPIPASRCGIPSTAQAYSLNVTAVPGAPPLNWLTAWPAGQAQPLVSTLNSFDGRVIANAAIVPAGASGAVCVFVTNSSDVIVDINGYFAP